MPYRVTREIGKRKGIIMDIGKVGHKEWEPWYEVIKIHFFGTRVGKETSYKFKRKGSGGPWRSLEGGGGTINSFCGDASSPTQGFQEYPTTK